MCPLESNTQACRWLLTLALPHAASFALAFGQKYVQFNTFSIIYPNLSIYIHFLAYNAYSTDWLLLLIVKLTEKEHRGYEAGTKVK